MSSFALDRWIICVRPSNRIEQGLELKVGTAST